MVLQEDKNKKAIYWLCSAHFANDVYTGFLNPIMPFIAAKLGFTMGIATIIIAITYPGFFYIIFKDSYSYS